MILIIKDKTQFNNFVLRAVNKEIPLNIDWRGTKRFFEGTLQLIQ